MDVFDELSLALTLNTSEINYESETFYGIPEHSEAKRIWMECDLDFCEMETVVRQELYAWAERNKSLHTTETGEERIVWKSPSHVQYNTKMSTFLLWFFMSCAKV